MSSMFAAKSDVARYTGMRTRDDQAKELARRGISFDTNSRGELLVLRATLEEAVTGKTRRNPRKHNFEALRREKGSV